MVNKNFVAKVIVKSKTNGSDNTSQASESTNREEMKEEFEKILVIHMDLIKKEALKEWSSLLPLSVSKKTDAFVNA